MDYTQLDARVDALRDELIEDLKKWISVPSVKGEAEEGAPYGAQNRRMLNLAMSDAKRFGFDVRDVDGRACDVSYGQGEQTMGMLCHLDVVPAGDGWQHDPWGAQIEDGRIYGRGTADDKGPALCALYAMRAVKECGIPLKDGVRLILGCDEETGMSDMRYYASKYKMPDYGFSPDADFPVINIEKGSISLCISSYTGGEQDGRRPVYELYAGERCNVVPGIARAVLDACDHDAFKAEAADLAKRRNWNLTVNDLPDGRMELVAEGVSAHASLPHLGVNAAGILLIALKELDAGTSSHDAIAALADKIGLEYDGESLGSKQSDELSGALTCNLGILRYDGMNLTAQLDIRYPLCADEKDMCGAAAMALSPAKLALTRLGGHTPHHVPAEHKIVRGLLKVYHEVTGLPAYAFAIGGGTYSRMMPNTVAFGINFPGDADTCHMPDEFIDLDKMMLSVKIFAHAIAELAGGQIQ